MSKDQEAFHVWQRDGRPRRTWNVMIDGQCKYFELFGGNDPPGPSADVDALCLNARGCYVKKRYLIQQSNSWPLNGANPFTPLSRSIFHCMQHAAVFYYNPTGSCQQHSTPAERLHRLIMERQWVWLNRLNITAATLPNRNWEQNPGQNFYENSHIQRVNGEVLQVPDFPRFWTLGRMENDLDQRPHSGEWTYVDPDPMVLVEAGGAQRLQGFAIQYRAALNLSLIHI